MLTVLITRAQLFFRVDTIICEVDKQEARERVQKRKKLGGSKRDKILKISKKLTAGKLVIDGQSYHLDENVLEQVQRRKKQIETKEKNKNEKDLLDYLIMCHKANEVKLKYTGIPISDWKRKDEIVTYLRPLKRDGDSAIPNNRWGVEE